MISYSPDFKLNKLNNYDNFVKNVPRKLYETCDFTHQFPKDSGKKEFQIGLNKVEDDVRVNYGSSMGPGGRAVLYGSWVKK